MTRLTAAPTATRTEEGRGKGWDPLWPCRPAGSLRKGSMTFFTFSSSEATSSSLGNHLRADGASRGLLTRPLGHSRAKSAAISGNTPRVAAGSPPASREVAFPASQPHRCQEGGQSRRGASPSGGLGAPRGCGDREGGKGVAGTLLANSGHPRASPYPRAPRGSQVLGRLRVPGWPEQDSPAGESCWKMLFTGSPSLRRDQHSTTLLVWLDAHSNTWGGRAAR